MWFVFVIAFAVFFIIFLFIAITMFKDHKKEGKELDDMVATISAYAVKEGLEQKFPTEEQPKDITCAYCGVKNPADASHCSSCGASLKKKK